MTISHNIEWINPHLAAALAPVVGVPGYLVYALTEPLPGSDKPNKVPCNPDTGRIEPPNDPTSRGVLTYQQAEAKADALGDRYGVGMHPAKFPDLVALDFDGCVEVTAEGTIRLAGWVSEIVGDGEVYCEVSPSMTGLRALLLDKVGHLKRLATGFERHNVGVYGAPGSGKFVTITGVTVEESALVVGEAPGVVSRVLTYFASKLGEDRVYGGGGLDYPMGLEGVREAEADILSGASLHPAMMRIVTGLMNTSMPAQEIREHLIGLMQQSKARGSTRWATRMRGIDGATGIMAWVAQRQGYRAQDRNGIEQQRATARALVERFSGRWKGTEAPRVNGTVHEPNEPQRESIFSDSLKLTEQEQEQAGNAARILGIPFEEALALIRELGFDAVMGLAEEEEDGEALAAVAELLAEPEAGPDWEVLERAPQALRELAEAAMAGFPREYPEVAVMAALSALSAATGNGFAVRGMLGNVTPLSLYTVALAPSGAVKSYVEGFISMMVGAVGIHKDTMPGSKAGFREMLGDHAFKLHQEGDTEIVKWPAVALIAGEIGMMLQGMGGVRGKPAGHDDAVMALLFDLTNAGSAWGLKAGILERQRVANKVRPRIENPYVTLAGFSTSAAYYGGLTQQMVEQGLGNRFMVFSAEYTPDDRDHGYRMPEGLPDSVLEALGWLSDWTYPERRTAASGALHEGLRRPPGKPWHRPQWMVELPQELFGLFSEGERSLRAAFRDAGLPEVMVARFYETAVKVAGLATVWGLVPMVGEMGAWGAKVEISREAAEYGCWLTHRLLLRTGHEIAAKTAASPAMENVERLRKIAIRLLANPDNPPGVPPARREATAAHLRAGGVPRAVLIRLSKLSLRDADEALNLMQESGDLCALKVSRAGSTKGMEAVIYRFVR